MQHTQQNSPSGKWYLTIAELPLSRFIDCLVDGNLSALIISGYPAPTDLEIAWTEIQDQYNSLMGDATSKHMLQLFKEITICKMELEMIISLVDLLSHVNNPKLEQMLNSLVLQNFKFAENREEELRRCISLSKSLVIKLQLKTDQYEAMKGKLDMNPKVPTREYFQSFLLTLSEHAQYQVTDSISTFDFCERVKRLNEYITHLKQSNGRRQIK